MIMLGDADDSVAVDSAAANTLASKKRAKPVTWSFKTLFDIISNSANAQTISWHQDGKSFKVSNEQDLLLLLKYGDSAKFSNFTQRLRRYGFSKKEVWCHPNFMRGRPELLVNIKSKDVISKKQKNSSTYATPSSSNHIQQRTHMLTAAPQNVSGGSINVNVQNVVGGVPDLPNGTSGGHTATAAVSTTSSVLSAAVTITPKFISPLHQQYYNEIMNQNPQQLSTLITTYKASTCDQIRATVPVLSHFSDNDIQLHIRSLEERLRQTIVVAVSLLQQSGNRKAASLLQQTLQPQAKSSSIATDAGENTLFKPINAGNKTPVTSNPAPAVHIPSTPAARTSGGVCSASTRASDTTSTTDNGSVGAAARNPGVSASTPGARTPGVCSASTPAARTSEGVCSAPTTTTDTSSLPSTRDVTVVSTPAAPTAGASLPSRAVNVVTPTISLLDAKKEKGQLKKMGDDVQNGHLNHMERMIKTLEVGMIKRLSTYVDNASAKFDQSYEEITERTKQQTRVIEDDNNKLAIDLGNLSFDTSQDNSAKQEEIRGKKRLNDSKLVQIKEEEARSKEALCQLYKSICKDKLKEMSHQGRINVEDRITHLYTRLDNHFNKKA